MRIVIRRINFEDAPCICRLTSDLGYEVGVDEMKDRIRDVLSAKDNVAFIACSDKGEGLGWIHAFKASRLETNVFIEIGGLVVGRPHRQLGVGKLLVQEVQAWCRQKSITDLRVRSRTERADAHAFYAKLGFTETKEQKVFRLDL